MKFPIVIALISLIASAAAAPMGKIPVPNKDMPSIEARDEAAGVPSDPWQIPDESPIYYDCPGWQKTSTACLKPVPEGK